MMMFVSRKRASMPGRRSAASFLHHVYGVLVMGHFGHLLVGQRLANAGMERYAASNVERAGLMNNFAVLDPEGHPILGSNAEQVANRSGNGDLPLRANAADCLLVLPSFTGTTLTPELYHMVSWPPRSPGGGMPRRAARTMEQQRPAQRRVSPNPTIGGRRGGGGGRSGPSG